MPCVTVTITKKRFVGSNSQVSEVDIKRSLDSAGADSTCFLPMWSPQSFFVGEGGADEEFVFFLNFLCTFVTHDCLNFSWKVSWRIRFPDTASTFSVVKSLFLHLMLLSVCKI